MKNFFKTLPIFLIGVVVVALMVANRDSVVVSLSPFQYEMVVPLYLVFFGGLFTGLVIGGFLLLSRKLQATINLHRATKENNRLREQLKGLEREFDKKTDAHRAASGEPGTDEPQRVLAKEGG